MSDLIANTVFGTGPDDTVATVDVYKEKSTDPQNLGITSIGKKAVQDVAAGISEATSPASILEVVTVGGLNAKDTKQAALDKLKASVGSLSGIKEKTLGPILGKLGYDPKAAALGPQGLVANLKASSADRAAALISAQTGIGDVRVVVGDVEHIRKLTEHVDSAQDVVNLMNAVTGNSALGKISIIKNQMAVIGGVMSLATRLRIPEAIDAILGHLGSDKERREVTLDTLRQSIMNSDLYAIGKTLDFAGANGVLARVPDAIALLVAFYQLPAGVSSPNDAVRDQLINILNRIDPHWHEYKRDTTYINNLTNFTYANDVCLSVLARSSTYTVPCMIAKTYPSVSILQKAKDYQPLAAIQAR